MHKALSANKAVFEMACTILDKGFNKDAFLIFSQSLDNMKDIAQIMEHEQTYGAPQQDNKAMVHMRAMQDLFLAYMDAKADYKETHSEVDKKRMLSELGCLLDEHKALVTQIMACTDCDEEVTYIKSRMHK